MKSRCAYLHKVFQDGVLLWAEVVSPEGSDSSYCIIRTTAVQLHGERGGKKPQHTDKKPALADSEHSCNALPIIK